MSSGLFWLAWVLAFFGFEAFTLWREDDRFEPFTYYVRKTLWLRGGVRSPGWWIIAGGIAWLGVHFLIEI